MSSPLFVRAASLALVVLAPVAACSREPISDRPAEQALQSEVPRATDAPPAAPRPAFAGDAAKISAERRTRLAFNAATGQLPAVRDTSTAPSMIIRVGDVSVLVDSLEPAVALVRQLAERLGGFVANTAMQTGPEHIRSATLTLRVPSARYDEALGGLEPVGEIETVHTNAEDVGEEFVDVQARVANARRLETRLVELLATRTGRLDDVLAVERELARVREEIERYEGRLRFLRARVSLSTLTVTVHEPAPLVGVNPGANVIGDAFVDAWRNFVAFLAALIAALGWLVPAGLIGAGVVAIARRFAARLVRRPRPLPPADDHPSVAAT
ncbi:MAG TPA: DUF4349 domain-containing protein [Gemmatimonadaceae bacterium]|nr:DUF4349 domain-containing protein [Gemmatimonadaceae bacterium]